MHSKRLGNLGELKVASFLVGLGYSVFLELGDISKIDLVLEYHQRLLGIQVIAISKKNGAYPLKSTKSGPGYRFRYTREDCDIFAVYCIEDDVIAWIRSSEITGDRANFSFRSDPPENNQKIGINLLQDYTDITRVLRDYEQNTSPVISEGDDIVQTTTEMASES